MGVSESNLITYGEMDITGVAVRLLAHIHGKDEVTGSNPVRGSIFIAVIMVGVLF